MIQVRIIYILFLFTFFVNYSCEPKYKYESGEMPTIPQNLEDFNSTKDDYNSTAPTLGLFIPLCFSSNYFTGGNHYDVVYKPMTVSFGKSTGIFRVLNSYAEWGIYDYYDEIFYEGLKKINTEGNELGPFFMVNNNTMVQEYEYLFLYATDIDGNFDIRFTYKLQQDTIFMESLPVEILNSDYDDLYPFVDYQKASLFFCSNRDGNSFNIYSLTLLDPEYNLMSDLTNINQTSINKEITLSSEYDDKCPFLLENTMLFASNRPGGFGGYDIYFSNYVDGVWEEPQNLGETINSEADEFRPILINEGVDTEKNMMIYSSNREGGKGGFDLYFVGISKFL
jgi:hypothetical protein